jgi:4-hydroxybenzoate polyprenyltransferase/phosphoserine phosphatase
MKSLVVDLDGTLIKTDLLLETANQFVARHPLRFYQVAQWLLAGKCALKSQLAHASEIDPASLPYNEPLLAWLRKQKEQGRHLVLATASHQQLADRVAAHLGLFDTVIGTDVTLNLKSGAKRDWLVERFGDKGFDYIGNEHADLKVWQTAHRAHVVDPSPSLRSKLENLGNLDTTFNSGRRPAIPSLVKTLRPHQWVKNLLVFVPLVMAQQYGHLSSVIETLFAFLIFSMTASSVYVLNDLVDVQDDRHHARKRLRSIASGSLSIGLGWVIWPSLLVLAFALSLVLQPNGFTGFLLVYFLLTLAYSFRLKKSALVDVLVLASLYTLRIIAGAAAIQIIPSFWLLAFSMFLFLSLAFIKRYSELRTANFQQSESTLRGRGYSPDDLEVVSTMGITSGYLSVMVLALYVNSNDVERLYRTPQLIWLACPLMLYWISRAWLVAHRGQMHDDPIVYAIKDKKSWWVVGCLIVVFGFARVGFSI